MQSQLEVERWWSRKTVHVPRWGRAGYEKKIKPLVVCFVCLDLVSAYLIGSSNSFNLFCSSSQQL